MDKIEAIAIIGGGVSGVSVFVNLVEKANVPLTVLFFEKTGVLGKGVAFGTKASFHPLNVKACRMGIYPDKPDDFFQWLIKNEGTWRMSDPSYRYLPLDPEGFYPRMIYGLYLTERFREAALLAKQKGISIAQHTTEIEDIKFIEGKLNLFAKGNQNFDADWAILATGIPPVKRFNFETDALISNPSYIRNIWKAPVDLFAEEKLSKVLREPKAKAVIIGSGLTAVDALLSLIEAGFQGNIDLISRSGHLPFAHSKHKPDYVIAKLEPAANCLQMFRAVRKEWKEFLLTGKDWREFIDALRPHTVSLWKNLDHFGKQQFLRLLFSNWNRLRHRMSPESGEAVFKLFENLRLKKIAGTISKVENKTKDKYLVTYQPRTEQTDCQIEADLVFNCTGPEYFLSKRKDPLLDHLLKEGIVLPDPLGKGLKTNGNEQLQGKNGGRLFALGNHLFGENLETVAVPEIRSEGASIAKHIISAIRGSYLDPDCYL